MDKNASTTISMFGILSDAFRAYRRRFLSIVAICSLNVFFFKLLQLALPLSKSETPVPIQIFFSLLFFCAWLVVLGLGAFLNILIINNIRSQEKNLSFAASFDDARGRIIPYLKAYFLQVAMVLAFLVPAFFVQTFGRFVYLSQQPVFSPHARMVVLLITSTIFVTLLIAAFWYLFFFSLSPLVNAFENVGARRALRESRLRVKGNALRYLGVFSIIVLTYFFVGLVALAIVMIFTKDPFIFRKIDPVLMTLFIPLGISAWWMSYQRLTEISKDRHV
jgi:hypothetical protein